tara:strand:- start:5784 stop:6149 length:366 start_codon:yes stop_codon:yes gene_type:complete
MKCKNETPFWAKKSPEKWEQLKFNTEFLKKVLREEQELKCEYCGKEDLIIYEWCQKVNPNNVATIDHFYPKSKYEDLKRNGDNLVVSCHGCNTKKKDILWDFDKLKFPIKENKIDLLKNIL